MGCFCKQNAFCHFLQIGIFSDTRGLSANHNIMLLQFGKRNAIFTKLHVVESVAIRMSQYNFFCSHVNFKLYFCRSYQISTFWPPPCKDADHLRIMMTRMVVMMTIVIMTKTTFQGCRPSPGEHHAHAGTRVFPIHKPIAPGRRQRLEMTQDFYSH